MRFKLLYILLVIGSIAFAQSDDYKRDINTMVSLYQNYHHYFNEAPDSIKIIKDSIVTEEIHLINDYICALNNPDIDMLRSDFIVKPDTNRLKTIYIVNKLNYNTYAKYPEDSIFLIDSLYNKDVYYYELVANYYRMLFNEIDNENELKKYEDLNFNLDELNLNNDTEKAIFFLEAFSGFTTYIWGYMNIASPPNFKLATKYINNYPDINGEKYFYFTNLDFEDFDMHIYTNREEESYKGEYVNTYLTLLFYHYACASQKSKTKDEAHAIYTSSIINNENYWKYSKSPEIYKQLSY